MDLGEEQIVISGIAGRFPECDSVEEFKEKLLAGIDLVNDEPRYYPKGMFGTSPRAGKFKENTLSKFDANFFNVHGKLAKVMDPQIRILHEVVYEAILDSGYNPSEFRGTNTGVFVTSLTNDALEYWERNVEDINGYGISGACRAMSANRISYVFDLLGPSYAIDSACSGSLVTLNDAWHMIQCGQCDAAIVGGINLGYNPRTSLQYQHLGATSSDGKCKTFDILADGYVRSEAIVALVLQKKKVARRIYTDIVYTKSNADGYKTEGINFPSKEIQKKLLQEIYSVSGVEPNMVTFFEAHGTGTKVGDPQEMNSVTEVLCVNRTSPLLIGSVKSNVGHCEPCSGLAAVAKIIIAMEIGIIPANLHFKTPNPKIVGLLDGRLKVVDRNTPWEGGYVGCNSFGFGGANAHAIFRSNKDSKRDPNDNKIPKLVFISGRTESAVINFLERIEKMPLDHHFIALIHKIHSQPIVGHDYRGFAILKKDKFIHEVDQISREGKRPIWFFFSGLGSQWPGMARDLMTIPVFEESIRKSAQILKTEEFNLMDTMFSDSPEVINNILNSIVIISSIQIALVDLMKNLEIEPDGICGHSLGEVASSYADNAFTHEQAVLCAYWRARTALEKKVIKGAMASVGLPWEEVEKRLPSDIYIACNNASDNVTISGPLEAVNKFCKQLQEENIFVKEVSSGGFAFHSRYVAEIAPLLREKLLAVIPNPKPRSSRWFSTSVPEDKWNTSLAKFSSADYQVNNLVSPVLLNNIMKHVPNNAIIIELGPRGLFQSVLKRSLPKTCSVLTLTKRNQPGIDVLLTNLGKIYNAGGMLKISKLYPEISFPVPRGTPMISHMIEWDHSVQWDVPDLAVTERSGEESLEINLSNNEDEYLKGHAINGRVIFPAAGYIFYVWKTFAKLNSKTIEQCPVVFENIKFHRATIIPQNGVKFNISIFGASGNFEMCEGQTLVFSGKITLPENVENEFKKLKPLEKKDDADIYNIKLTHKDIYKLFRVRGYDYSGIFQGVMESDTKGEIGHVKWEGNWVVFFDLLFQYSILGEFCKELLLPVRMKRLIIDPIKHLKAVKKGEEIRVNMYKNLKTVKCGGIEVFGIKTNSVARKTQDTPKVEQYLFLPYIETTKDTTFENALTNLVQITLENFQGEKLKVIEIVSDNSLLSPEIRKIVELEPKYTAELTVVTSKNDVPSHLKDLNIRFVFGKPLNSSLDQNADLIIASNKITDSKFLSHLTQSLGSGGFVLLEENSPKFNETLVKNLGLKLIAIQKVENKNFILLRKANDLMADIVIQVTDKNFAWVDKIKEAMKRSEEDQSKIILYSQEEEHSGILGMINCLKKESGGENIRCFFIKDSSAPVFNLNTPHYTDQARKDLVINVFEKGQWGSFRHLLIKNIMQDDIRMQVEHAYLNTLMRGDLSSVRWIESPISLYKPTNKPEFELIQVYNAALNFRDLMFSTGRMGLDDLADFLKYKECVIGLEFSGKDSKGRHVMGITHSCGLATSVLADPLFVWEVPTKMTLEEAATIPLAYCTVYSGFIISAKLQPGESVLIHSGTGAVGQAAITIALHMNCRVFVTVGSQEKKAYLLQQFPKLKENHIGNSHDTSFEQMVMDETDGKGVDVILNSLSEEKLQASLRCLALGGRFIEIGRYDMNEDSSIGMSIFLKRTSFHAVLLEMIFKDTTERKKELSKLLEDGLKSGVVRPIPARIFNGEEPEKAFRFMASGKHMGKVVLQIRENGTKAKSERFVIPAIPRTYFYPDKSYIIIGGMGGFGLELVDWMIRRGAQRFVITSRSGVKSGYQSLCMRRWRDSGVKVIVSNIHIGTLEGAEKLIKEASALAPVGGIFNLAVDLRDALMQNQTQQTFEIVCDAKSKGTKNLDIVTRKLCPELNHFVVFSSISSGRGNPGQPNYGYANSIMERICETRLRDGFPGLAIQWGAIGDVGVVIEVMNYTNDSNFIGTLPQRIESCMSVIDNVLQMPYPVTASLVLAEKESKNKSVSSEEKNKTILDIISNTLGLRDIKSINKFSTLVELGMDSLMGTEIKQNLERIFDINLNIQAIQKLTLNDLEAMENSK